MDISYWRKGNLGTPPEYFLTLHWCYWVVLLGGRIVWDVPDLNWNILFIRGRLCISWLYSSLKKKNQLLSHLETARVSEKKTFDKGTFPLPRKNKLIREHFHCQGRIIYMWDRDNSYSSLEPLCVTVDPLLQMKRPRDQGSNPSGCTHSIHTKIIVRP